MTAQVTGLAAATGGLRAARRDLDQLDGPMGRIATEAAATMHGFIHRDTGALAGTVRAVAGGLAAGVTVGGPRAPYARAHDRLVRFVDRTDRVMETRAPQILDDAWGAITERHNLS